MVNLQPMNFFSPDAKFCVPNLSSLRNIKVSQSPSGFTYDQLQAMGPLLP